MESEFNYFTCGFYNRTKMKGCENQCSSCSKDQKIIDLNNKIKELKNENNISKRI